MVAALLLIRQPKKAAEEGDKPRRLLPKRLEHFKSHTLSDEAAALRAKTESLSNVVTALEPQQLAKNALLSVSPHSLLALQMSWLWMQDANRRITTANTQQHNAA